MKRMLIAAVGITMLLACNSGSKGEEGTMNDGIKAVDSNGALNDNKGPRTDTTSNAIENKTRTDIQQRDTFKTPGQ